MKSLRHIHVGAPLTNNGCTLVREEVWLTGVLPIAINRRFCRMPGGATTQPVDIASISTIKRGDKCQPKL